MKKILGILGGMGPAATADLFTKIVSMTEAGSDAEHIRVIIDSNSAIPDRTAAILSGGKDPVPEMLSALGNLEKCGAGCVILPCNTAHYFLPRLRSETSIPILNMPEAAAKRCAELYPGKKAAMNVLQSIGTKVITTAVTGAALYGLKAAVSKNFKAKEFGDAIFNGGAKKK